MYRATEQFYANSGMPVGDRFKQVQESKPTVKENQADVINVPRRAQAAFMGTSFQETESQGSQFQRNAAHFMGVPTPVQGERPFKVDKTMPSPHVETSYLNESRLREHVSNHF
jgi:hypothetical protein